MTIDELRTERYRTKINYIVENMKDLPLKFKNELEKRGIFYSLQTSIESLVDIIAMLIKDLGIEVKDDTSNIEEIVKKKKLSSEMEDNLKKANGMRNLIVHRYNSINEKLILDSVKDVKKLIFDWLEVVEELLSELSKN